MNTLDTPEKLFTWLKVYQPDTKYSQIVWESLANRYYYMIQHNSEYTDELKSNLLQPIMDLATQYQIQVPSDMFQKGWEFIENQIQGKELTNEQIQNIAYEFSRSSSTKDQVHN